MLVEKSTFRIIIAAGIDSIFRATSLRARAHPILPSVTTLSWQTTYQLRQISIDGTNYYPARDAAIAMFGDIPTTDGNVRNEVPCVYAYFQDIEISGNTIRSTTGTGIYLTGSRKRSYQYNGAISTHLLHRSRSINGVCSPQHNRS